MRNLAFLLIVISLAAQAAAGYPVYSILGANTYKVNSGTAFTVKYKGQTYMITNWHVCRNFLKSDAINEQSKTKETVTIIKRFPDSDLCVLTTDRENGLEISGDVSERAAVYTAGYPEYEKKIQFRSGHTTYLRDEYLDYGPGACPKSFTQVSYIDPVTKKTTQACKHTQLIMDTNLEGTCGNSGSPVVNSKGQLVGIVHSRSEGSPADDKHNTLNYIPVSELTKILDSL